MSKVYAVEQVILDEKYHITLNHSKIRRIDRALKKMNAGLGVSTNGGSILQALAVIMYNAGLEKISNEDAIQGILTILDTDTMFTMLPIMIDEKITEEDIEKWLLEEEDDDKRLSQFMVATWFSEAALCAGVVRLATVDGSKLDPKTPLVVIRILRGVASKADIEYLQKMTKANA